MWVELFIKQNSKRTLKIIGGLSFTRVPTKNSSVILLQWYIIFSCQLTNVVSDFNMTEFSFSRDLIKYLSDF